jgi:hypothetical protein
LIRSFKTSSIQSFLIKQVKLQHSASDAEKTVNTDETTKEPRSTAELPRQTSQTGTALTKQIFCYRFPFNFFLTEIYVKCKAIPLQAWTGPEGSRSLRFQISRQSDRWKGCQPYVPAAFTPSKYSWYAFLLEAEWTTAP